MSAPSRGKWEQVRGMKIHNGDYECWRRWAPAEGTYLIEFHFHLPEGETFIFSHEEGYGKVQILHTQPGHPCAKCGRLIEFPDYDVVEPYYNYFPKYNRAIMKHAWAYHREDFPPEFTSVSQLTKWLTTPEGQAWEKKAYTLADTEAIMDEAEQILGKEDGV